MTDSPSDFTNEGRITENGSGDSDIQTNNGTIINLNGGLFNVITDNGIKTTDDTPTWNVSCKDTTIYLDSSGMASL